jgi:hypothetical protein
MVRLNVSLTFRTGLRLLFLAEFAAASLQTAAIAAQDSPRSRKSRADDGLRQRGAGNREDNRQSIAENDRRGRFAFSRDNRRPDSNREGRKPFQQFFQEGHFDSQPTNEGFVFVVALSLLDLVWTLLVSQAGTMRELNPVGGRLIDAPAKLIAFKVARTGCRPDLQTSILSPSSTGFVVGVFDSDAVDRSVANIQFDARMNPSCICNARSCF